MSKFTFICDHDNIHGEVNSTVTFMTNKEYLPEILEDFELFLRGAGFVFDGMIDIVEPDYSVKTGCTGCGGCNAN
jgi:hypothetical protein